MVPLVIRIEDLQTGAVSKSAFIKSPVRIGRSELNDLPLPQGFVSQWHAVVQFDETEARYVDLGSTNGSIVDGVRIERNAPVPIGGSTEIRIGSLKLTLSRRSTGEHRAPPRTLFAIRAATAFRPAAQAPGALAEGGPAAPAAAPDADESSRAAAARPPEPAGPTAGSLEGNAPEVGVPSERAPPASVLDLPTGSRSAAPPPAPPAPATSGPVLDLPTDFRPAVAAPPPAPAIPAGAPMLDLPTDFRPAVRHPGSATPPAPPAGTAPAPGGWAPAGPSDVERLVTTFAESYLPASVRIGGLQDAEAFLGKLAETLEAFARAFVEMRKGYEEFGKQMGIRTVHGDGPVQRARDPRQLIAALLDPGQPGRAAELQASFADYMVHQVALLNGVVEGAKAILSHLSPEEIEAGAPQSLWPLKAQTLWRSFEERFHELTDEEGAISDALFGREFGKAYTAIVGQHGAPEREEDDGGEDEDDEDAAPRRPARRSSRPRRR